MGVASTSWHFFLVRSFTQKDGFRTNSRIICGNDVSAAICSSVSHLDGNEWARAVLWWRINQCIACNFCRHNNRRTLIFFHKGNQLLSLTMSSLLFYSNPTAQLLLGVVAFSEQFLVNDLIAFSLIWIGIAVYFMTRRRVANRVITGS